MSVQIQEAKVSRPRGRGGAAGHSGEQTSEGVATGVFTTVSVTTHLPLELQSLQQGH